MELDTPIAGYSLLLELEFETRHFLVGLLPFFNVLLLVDFDGYIYVIVWLLLGVVYCLDLKKIIWHPHLTDPSNLLL